jgi:hypothetical protein
MSGSQTARTRKLIQEDSHLSLRFKIQARSLYGCHHQGYGHQKNG